VPRKTTVQDFSFLEGPHQEIDPKILPDGYLSACKNVRLRKDGRWGVRADYTALGNDTDTSVDLLPRDLIGFGDRLCALSGANSTEPATIWDIFDYTGTGAEWHPSSQVTGSASAKRRVSNVTGLRLIPAYSAESLTESAASVTRVDCAAAGGVVCSAYSDGTVDTTDNSFFRFIRASDLATLLEVTIAGIRPRVVSVGTTFFFTTVNGTSLRLSKFDPTTDATHTVLTAASSASFSAYDLVTNRAGNGFWLAVNKTTPTTSIIPYTSSGVAGTPITGPAVLYDHIAIRETLTRLHLVTVLAAGACQLYSYTLAGALSTGPTTVDTDVNRQPGIADAQIASLELVDIVVEQSNVAPSQIVHIQQFDATTHVLNATQNYLDSFLGAKPIYSGSVNLHSLFGVVVADGAFLSTLLASTVTGIAAGVSTLDCYTNKFAALKPEADHTPQIAKDSSTGKLYWPTIVSTDEGYGRPVLTEIEFITGARRQTAQIAGLLYLAGGFVGVYDGRALTAAGFFEKPRIFSATPTNGAGALPSSTTLLVAVVWEARDAFDNVISSDISDVTSVVMGAADDTITVSASRPHGWRFARSVTCVAYRSVAGINQLRRAESTDVFSGGAITLLASDATIRTHGVIYTQAGRGALGTILPHEAPLPADYLWKFGNRILSANADGAQVSKEIFPTAEVEWSGAVGFTIPKISERITGCAALDQRGFLFTAERIYQFAGDGPNDAGEGRYSEPSPLPTSTGLMTWQSLVETPLGLFFQGSNGQLWVLPRDGSPPTWIGQPVRDTLVAFPTVTSATLVTKEQLVSFTCCNTALTDARVVSYDLRAKTWIVDEFTALTPIAAACSYQGRLAVLSSGVVYTERTSLVPSAFIEHGLTTGTVKPFNWGKICSVECMGEYRGDCNLRCRISYDDGKSYTNLATHLLRSSEFAVGDTVERSWAPLVRKCDGFRLDFQALTPGTPTEGFIFNSWRIEYMTERGASRRAAGARG
jgi:hypothetical protein